MRSVIASVLRSRVSTFRVEGKSKNDLRSELHSALPIVTVARCTNYRFVGVTPYQKAALVYLETRSRDAVRRCLSEILETDRPRCLADVLFGGSRPDLGPLNNLPPLAKFQPWRAQIKKKQRLLAPLDDEVEKVISTVQSLQRHGYQPEGRKRGYISGHFLLAGNDYRFLIKDGQHRYGAMRALGVPTEITVRIARGFPPVVSDDEIYDWPLVRTGACSPELGLKLLRRHFD